VRVSIYDRKTKRGTVEFFLAAFVDEKIIALKHVDFSFMPDLKMEDVAEELQRFVKMFKEEISEALVFDQTDDWTLAESKNRQHLKK
jgi:hypothetical protein